MPLKCRRVKILNIAPDDIFPEPGPQPRWSVIIARYFIGLLLSTLASNNMPRFKHACVVLLCLSVYTVATASITWVNSLDGPAGVQCSVTCGSKSALQGPNIALNVTPQACAVNSTAGSQIGTLWFNKNTLSCFVYSNTTEGQPVSVPYSSWFCPCLDRTTIVANTNGSLTETCTSSCSNLAPVNDTYYNSSITSCTQPSAQSICFDSVQSSFGYQPLNSEGNSNLACLTVNPPAQTTADTLPAQRSTAFQCLCSDANSTANLQISDSCSSVPYPEPPSAPPVVSPKSSSLSTGAIVGIAVGCAAAVALLAAGAILYVRRRNANGGIAGSSWGDKDHQNTFIDTEMQVSHEANFSEQNRSFPNFSRQTMKTSSLAMFLVSNWQLLQSGSFIALK